MKKLLFLPVGLLLAISSAPGALVQWQQEVGQGTPALVTHFEAITTPQLLDIGALSGDRAFEFIVNANTDSFGPSAALIGTQNPDFGRQGLKAKQWEGAENTISRLGLTEFGVKDHVSSVILPSGQDVHLVFTSNGADSTQLYLNGELVATFEAPLLLTGLQGIGAAARPDNSLEPPLDPLLGGTILGFVSYDSALSADEIAAHYRAFSAPVPEPGVVAFTAAAGLLSLARRARRSS